MTKKNEKKMPKNRKRFAVAALAGLLPVCGVAVLLQGQATQVPQAQTSPAPQAQQRRVKRVTPEEVAGKGKMALLENALKYPPESRPIDSTYVDLLHPWKADTQARPMYSRDAMLQIANQVAAQANQKTKITEGDHPWTQVQWPPTAYSFQFEMNKTILAGTQNQLQARLTVTPANSSDPNLIIHISKAEMIGSHEFGRPNLGQVPYSCETTGPVCTFTWHAPSEDKQYWGNLRLRVTLTVAGSPDEYVIGESFRSSPMVAGKFTGQFQERLENGSLVIDAGVEIQKHMACFVSANLYSADSETPLQYAERRILVDPSMKTISFTFFGKIFRDYGDEGTFRLQDLKAECENVPFPPEWFMDSSAHAEDIDQFLKKTNTPNEPTQIYFAYNNYTYTTQRYPNSAFSDAEWQSPEKDRRLEMEERVQALIATPKQ
jgi:hypothetical protein